MKAYSYVRFSTADQLKGDSQRRQVEKAERWCAQNKIELAASYKDLGISAFEGRNAETGALAKFLELVKQGRIPKGSFLIVESLDRVSRNKITKALRLFLDIIESGIKIVTLMDNRIYDEKGINNGGSADLIISITVMTRANEESNTKKERISEAWEQKRRNLEKVKMTAVCPGWLRLSADRTKFEPIPARVRIVNEIFDLAIHGNGYRSITTALNLKKVPTFGRAKTWGSPYVKKILETRAVIGEFRPGCGTNGHRTLLDSVDNYFPAVVSKEKFATVTQVRKLRPNYCGRSAQWKGKHGRNLFNVFSKLAFDRTTGTPMVYANKKRAKHHHYLVPAACHRNQLNYQAWNYDEFMALFLLVCEKSALTKPSEIKLDDKALAIAQTELDSTNLKLDNLADFLATKGSSETVERKLRAMEETKKDLESTLSELSNVALVKPIDLGEIDWHDSDRLRENLRATVKKITVDAKEKWFAVEWLDNRPIHIFGMVNDMSDADIRAAEGKKWKAIKKPLSELFDLAKKKGYLPKTYQPKLSNDVALIFTVDQISAT